MKVDIKKWNERMGYGEYPATSKLFAGDPDVPFEKLPYRPGDVVSIEGGDFGVVLGCIDAFRRELRTDMAGMVSFSEIKLVKNKGDLNRSEFGKEILSFINQQKWN